MDFYFVESIDHLSIHGYHESFDVPQRVLDKLKECEKKWLIHQIMTVSRPTGKKGYVLCNCKTSSCIPLYLYKNYGIPIIRDSGYSVLIIDRTLCSHCGTCISRCQFDAVSLNDDGPVTNSTQCMGCGLCVSTCPAKIRKLVLK